MKATVGVLSVAIVWSFAMQPAAGQPAAAQRSNPPHVAVLMFDGAQIIDFAGPYEVFGQAGFDVYTVTEDGAPVTAAMNLSVNVDHDFASAPQADVLLIPGGHIHDAMADPATLKFIRNKASSADHVLSVCTGSFVLAATGLLDGKTATTFHGSFDSMAREFPEIKIVRDRRWVDTGKLVTSAGLSSGIDAALHIVAEIRGVEAARTVAMNLEYEWAPGERDGFIRGLMADRHVRFPSNMTFPEGTQAHVVTSFGSEQDWRRELHVQSPLGPSELIAHLRDLAAGDDALRLEPDAGPHTVAWRHTDDAGQWRLTVSATSANRSGGGIKLVEELAAID
jgi:putative intracellular protease/amidase